MVSTNHKEAEFYYNRDINCITTLFKRRYGFECDRVSNLKDIKIITNLDNEVLASGFAKRDLKELRKFNKI